MRNGYPCPKDPGVDLVNAPLLDGPVSLSQAVFDNRGNVLTTDQELRIVSHFSERRSFWSYFVWLRLNDDWDVTDLANRELREHGGDAIVNFRVTAESNAPLFVSLLVPLIPAYVTVEISGDVVQRESD